MKIQDDLLCYGQFSLAPKGDVLGTYDFFVAMPDAANKPFVSVLIYSANVREKEGHTLLDYQTGEPPSAKDGRALDLHRAAAARIKLQAAGLMRDRVYFIGDDGRLTEASNAGLQHRLAALYQRMNPSAPPLAESSP